VFPRVRSDLARKRVVRSFLQDEITGRQINLNRSPRVASAAAFSRLISSKLASHSICSTLPFFDGAPCGRCDDMWDRVVSTSSSSSFTVEIKVEGPWSSNRRCFSRKDAKSTSGSGSGSPTTMLIGIRLQNDRNQPMRSYTVGIKCGFRLDISICI